MSLEQNGVFEGKTALIFGSILVGGFAILAGLAAIDRVQRPQLERLEEPFAAGDPVVFSFPETAAPGSPSAVQSPAAPVVVVKGVPQFAIRRRNWNDGTMRKAGMDDSGKYPLYRHVKKDTLEEDLWLRFAPGKYAKLSPQADSSPTPSPTPAASAAPSP